jgi:acetone carboxylase gamma subunit
MDGLSLLSVKYLGVIFDKRITWRLHTEITEAKAFRTFIRIYSQFRIHKALIRSVMTYACPACDLAADTCHLK